MPLPSRSTRFAQRLRPLALAALAFAAASACALDRPSDERFQGWLQQEAQAQPPFFTGQFELDDTNRRLARAILDRLWDDKAYREWLHAWLDAHRAATAEDLVAAWKRDYGQAFADSLEFADKSQSLMWRLSGRNAMGAMDRAQCAQATPELLHQNLDALHARLLADHADELAHTLPAILAREFARRNHPQRGDRQVPEVMLIIARSSLQAEAATLSADDGARLVARFSYVPPDPHRKTTIAEICEQDWVVSHAIDDGRLDDSKHQVSSLLLQQQVTMAAYGELFANANSTRGAKPARAGFKPGKAVISMPNVLARNNVSGATTVRIRVDETGRYQSAALVTSSVQPEQVTSLDGSSFKSADLLLGVVDAYFRDGSFEPHLVDGVAKPDEFLVNFDWR